MKNTLDFIIAGSEVKRYHTVTTLVTETVGHHSHGVAMLVLLLNPDASGTVLRAALIHDLAECETGDIPSPAKRRFGINEQMSAIEEEVLISHGVHFPYLFPDEERNLKLADLAHGALFCAREISLGNSTMRVVFNRYIEYAEEMKLVNVERELFDIIKGKVQ